MTAQSRALCAVFVFAAAGCQQPPPQVSSGPVASSRSDSLFVNGGFETGSLPPDWTTSLFLNPGIATTPWPPSTAANLNLTAGGNNLTRIVTNAVTGSQPPAGLVAGVGVPMWPKFGQATAVVNEQGFNQNVNSIKQSYTTTSADVDPADGKIHARWVLAPVLENPNHPQEQQPYFFVVLRNITRGTELFNSFNFSNSPGTPWKAQGAILYTDWTIFDIAPGNLALRVGDTIEIEVYASGCSPGGHWGEVYVDGFGASFPGLSVLKTAPVQTNIDTDITYTFAVKNNTVGNVANVVADEVIPANTTFVSVTAPGATCTTPAVGGTGTVSCNFGWMTPGASNTFQVKVHAYTPTTKGTATAGGASTLTDSTKTWVANAYQGWSVYITGGTGAGQEREIGSNTGTQLTVINAWTTAPDATSTYAVVVPPDTQGTASGGANNSITDSSKTWVANAYSGYTVYIVAGTGAGQSRTITNNNATRLTVTPNWGTQPNNTSVYAVKQAPKVTNGDYGVSGDAYARLLGPRAETTITGGIPFADLGVTISDGVPALAWGAPVQYTVTVTNNGPLAVSGALVTDTLPAQLQAGATWACAGSAGGSCTTASGTGNLNNTVNLPVGGVATFTISGNIVAGAGSGSIVHSVTVAPPAGVTDNSPGNNSDVDIDGLGVLVPLSVTKGPGAGQGTVTSSPVAIACGNGCSSASANFLTGTTVTLTAVARTGDTFAGWSGACTGTGISCTVTLAASTSVVANFVGLAVVGSAPGGNGTVTCVPSDVAQGGSSVCTVNPASGYGLAGLTDNGANVTASVVGSTYTLTNVTIDHAVVATFGALPLTPTITIPTNGTTTNNNRPPITGTTSPNVSVTVRVDGNVVCSTTSNGAGTFTCTPGSALADGAHSVTATATNANGTTPASTAVNITIDTVAPAAPVVVTPANGSRTNNNRPPITGTAEANSTVNVSIDGVAVGTTTANGAGAWTFTPATPLTEGSHTARATSTDAGGNTSVVSNTNTFTVDTTAPAAPVVVTPANGSRTNNNRPPITGTAEATSTVNVSIDGVAVGTATADGAGAWTFTPATPLADGSHTARATSTDAAGNTSVVSNTNTFTVDTTAPAAPVVVTPANGSRTNNNRPPITGTAEANSTVNVSIDGAVVGTATANGAGAWTFTPVTPLADGSHTARATATDAAGNTSVNSNTNTFTVDTTAPAAPVVVTPANGSRTNNNRPPITGTAEANSTVNVSIDGAVVGTATANGAGAWTFTPVTPLADGSHTARATATDAAGNTSVNSNTNTFTVDTTPPAAPVVLTPANGSTTNNNRPAIAGTAEANSTVNVSIDGAVVGTATANGAGAWTFTPTTPLADGSHTTRATATDAAGNTSVNSNTNTFTVDTTAPAAPVVVTPANGSTTNNNRPPITGTAEANSTVNVSIDGAVVGTATANGAGAWTFTPTTPLTDGSHTTRATATDAAGNTSVNSNTNTFTVDTTPPAAPVVVTPANGSTTNNNRPAITGTAEANSTVNVSIDGAVVGTATANGAGAWTFTPSTPLADGSHTTRVTATDAAGNTSVNSNTNTFTVDTTPPAAPVVVTPANGSTTNNNRPAITGTAEANSTVNVSIDGTVVGTATANGAGAWTFTPATPLADGSHTTRATSTDAAGNTSVNSNTNTFTVDTTAPAAPVVATPANGSRTNNNRPPISGTAEANSTVNVSIDGTVVGTATANGAGAWTFTPTTPLSEGSHATKATSTDAAGNTSVDSNTNTFTVDTTAPAAPVITGPTNGATTTATPTITGTAEANSTVTVRVDGTVIGTATTNGSGAWTLTPSTPLSAGAHTLSATSADAAGNTSAPSNQVGITVEATAPTTPVLTSPTDGAITSDTTPTFTGTGTPASTVTVTVDGTTVCTAIVDNMGAFSCTPTTPLAEGPHVVTLSASNTVGSSPTSSPSHFTIDTTPPLTPVVVGPADGSRTTVTTPTITGTGEPGSVVTVRIDGTSVGTATVRADGTWSLTVPSPLSMGSHTVSATAVDQAGNGSLPSNTNHFTIDSASTAPVVTTPADNSATASTTPVLQGTATAGTQVTVFVDGVSVCSTTATAQGTFSCTPSSPLTEGVHTVKAQTPDGAGGQLTSNTNTFTIDTHAPGAPVVTTPANNSTTADTTPTIIGTAEPLSTVTVFVDGVSIGTTVANASGTYTIDVTTPLAAGSHRVNATATDRAGNVSQPSNTNTFTVGAATGPVVVTPADGSLTADKTPTVSGTGTPGTTVEARIDGQIVCTAVVTASGAWNCDSTTTLTEGAHIATVTQQGSTTTSNSNAFSVDSIAPAAPVISTPAEGAHTGATPTLSGTAEPGARVTVSVDGTSVCVALADAQGHWSCVAATPLGMGTHTVTATATDAAGNTSSPATPHTFTVDTTAPSAPVLTTPADGSTSTTRRPALSGTAEPGSTVTVSVDGQVVCTATADATSGAFSCTPSMDLTTGMHVANAVARDAAGNVSMASNSNHFTIEATAPSTPVITGPTTNQVTPDATPTITGTAEPGSTITVREGTTVLCTATTSSSGTWSCDATTLPDGSHGITATSTTMGQDSMPSPTRVFTVDTTGPTTTITGAPDGTTRDTTVTITLTSTETSTFECSFDGGPFTSCTSPVTREGLTPGTHTIDVRATDAAGNVGATAHHEWTVQLRAKGEFAGGCSCNTVDAPTVLVLLGVGAWLRRRRAR